MDDDQRPACAGCGRPYDQHWKGQAGVFCSSADYPDEHILFGEIVSKRKYEPPPLSQLLDDISVHGPGQWENENGPAGWYAVSTEVAGGIVAYFEHESHAYHFRMLLINATLNPLADLVEADHD